MSARLKIKRGSTASWANSTNKNTTLEPGQLGVEYLADGNMRLKVGKHTSDGSATDWSSLPYATPKLSVYQDDHIELSKGQKSMYISSDGTLNVGENPDDGQSPSTVLQLNANDRISLYSIKVVSSCNGDLGSSDMPWGNFYTTGDVYSLTGDFAIRSTDGYFAPLSVTQSRSSDNNVGTQLSTTGTVNVSTAGATTDGSNLVIYNNANASFSSSAYGAVENSIILKPKKVIKTSSGSSSKTYDPSIKVTSAGDENGDKIVLTLEGSGKVSSTSDSTNSLVIHSLGDNKTSGYGESNIEFKCSGYSDSSYFTESVFLGSSIGSVFFYPYTENVILGNPLDNKYWGTGFIRNLYIDGIHQIGTGGIVLYSFIKSNIIPSDNESYSLGSDSNKWRYVYASQGVVQTSDRSAKDSIHYIEFDSSSEMKVSTMSLRSTAIEDTSTSTDSSSITVEDVIDFVSNLSPVTFCYKDGQDEDVEATEENSEPEAIQLGLIADDIKDHKLFKYVGVETTYEEEVTPAVKDEEGNVVTEAVTETKTTLGLQAIPLATAALTACKYLIQKNTEIESRLSAIEDQLTALLNTDGN